MKKLVLLFFATAMMAVTVFTTSCNKDDDDDFEIENWYNVYEEGDPFAYDGKGIKPVLSKDAYTWGYNFDITWSKANSFDTTQFEYELVWSLKKNGEVIETQSFGRQRDTVFHFVYDPAVFKKDTNYSFILFTYYWYNNHEHRIAGWVNPGIFYIPTQDKNLYWYRIDGSLLEMYFFHYKHVPMDSNVRLTICDTDDNNNITKQYAEYSLDDFSPCSDDEYIYTGYIPIPEGWSGTIYWQIFNANGSLRYESFDIIEL